MAPKNPSRRALRRNERDNMDVTDEEMEERRANTSSEDEGDDATDTNDNTASIHPDPSVANLIQNATQNTGILHADGGELAVAAMQQSSTEDAFRLLAAATAKTSITTQLLKHRQDRLSANTAHAVVTADLASEDIRNTIAAYDNRYKRMNSINDQLDASINALHDCINAQQDRLKVFRGMLTRVLTMLLNNKLDATQISEMLRELNI